MNQSQDFNSELIPRGERVHRAGFTLIEVLVTLGIIVVLAALALPMLARARRIGFVTRTQADMGAISMALEAYKADFGDYPRVAVPGTGFAVLGAALVAPGGTQPPPAYDGTRIYGAGEMCMFSGNSYLAINRSVDRMTGSMISPSNPNYWVAFPYNDFCDGPGFRIRANVFQGQYQGKVYGPYLSPEKFNMRGLALLDLWGNPILYCPASPVQLDITQNHNYAWDSRDTSVTPLPVTPRYDFAQNYALLGSTPMPLLMGDRNSDGHIGSGESAAFNGPFILWSAGPDGIFGFPSMQNKTDDILNFDLPGELKK